MEKAIYAGELNRQVEFFKRSTTRNASGESVKGAPVSMGIKRVKRVDVSGNEEDEGRILSLSVCKVTMRFDREFLINGTEHYFQDVDGKFQVNSVSITGPGRNRFLELKCSSRE